MAETVIPVTNGLNGNITDCKIETAQIKIDRKGTMSFSQKETYRTYDVCTKQTVSEYTASTITGAGIAIIILVPFVLLVGWVMFMTRGDED
jgi:preprotein translocase subunit YajC